jgi:hypothetical protein
MGTRRSYALLLGPVSVALVASSCGARTGLLTFDDAPPACATPAQSPVPACDGQTTTLDGTVYDPAGHNPLYNVVVYVPGSAPAPLPSGATCDSCSDLYTGSPIATTLTDAAGHFVLNDVPPGNDVPLVLQIGKWRRQLRVPTVVACQENPLADGSLTLPKSQSEGDIPAIAVSTGGSDTLECLFRRIGVDASEYTGDPLGAGRIHVFQGTGKIGGESAPNTAIPAPSSASSLWDSVADLERYDMVFLSCEGQETTNMNQQALFDYAASGGRVFASHFHYAWFDTGPFGTWNLATWLPGKGDIGDIDTVVTTTLPNGAPFAKGNALAQWLGTTGALLANGELAVEQARDNADLSPANTASQSWLVADADASAPGASQAFSFNAPLDAPTPSQCGQVVYTAMHVGAASNDNPGLPVPDECATGDLSPQETALEFLVFNLSSCVTPADQMPRAPPSCR